MAARGYVAASFRLLLRSQRSQLFPNAPRGFSVHVFKNSAPPPPLAPVVTAPKFETIPARPSTGTGQWTRQQSYYSNSSPQHELERKQAPVAAAPALSQDHRLVHVPTNKQPWPVETKKSQKSYGIYPSLTSDIYIYERSITEVSLDDDLASSPSSDSSSSSDSDLLYHNTATLASLEISSTRASSSTETLESTLTPAPRHGTLLPNALPSSRPPPPSLPAITAAPPPRPASTRPNADRDIPAHARSAVSASVPQPPTLTRAESHVPIQRTISVSHATVPPIQLASASLANASDSDSETVISETHANDMVVDMLGAHQWAAPQSSYSYPSRSSTPFRQRRDSDARTYRRDAPAAPASSARDPREREVPAPRPPYQHRAESPRGEEHPRAPPGLGVGNPTVATPPDGSGARGVRDAQSSSSPTARVFPATSSAPPLARTQSSRPGPPPPPAPSHPGPQPRNTDMGSSHLPPPPLPTNSFASPPSSSPPRRDARTPSPQHSPPGHARAQTPSPQTHAQSSNGSPTAASVIGAAGALVVAAAAKRSVRWTENLVCPSPVPPESRRKGWFNRRG